ncbi:hypothetical protein LB577_27385 [Mesorhizobium sp. B283B1A]|uniref:hypothetical protein n=1 Tax=Mesorhizobium TaxID=68287 RepID=UPI001CD06CD0|nr:MULTISPECIES: hypothetical protein [Mesorhizobium]MCA0050631.1 hypothetical protein [Mesorhizobium sp. B283B1A]UQS66937.1 hypothetical protein M5D98_11670 [Mesorhizobium opportunistum]
MNDVDRRRHDFERNAPAWLVVRHFLPAGLVLELFGAIVRRWGRGKITLDDLARFDLSEGQPSLASLAYRPHSKRGTLARALSQLFQSIVWQGDQSIGLESDQQDSSNESVAALKAALVLSHRDLARIEQWSDQIAGVEGLGSIVSAMSALSAGLSNNAANLSFVEAQLAEFDGSPVKALLLKHLGDLAADVDRWEASEAIYQRAGQLIGIKPGTCWESLGISLRTIVGQSYAAAVQITRGPSAAATLLDELIDGHPSNDPLPLLNASFDAMGAHLAAGDLEFQGERGSVLLAPQLINAHQPGYGLANSQEGRQEDSNRWFWAVLRRQIALGSALVSRDTKASYARSLINFLTTAFGKNFLEEEFLMAVRLLLESGRDRTADTIFWEPKVVAAYVTLPLVEAAVQHANRHAGAEIERRRVILVLARNWLKVLPSERIDVATALLNLLIRFAQQPNQTKRPVSGLSTEATKALGTIGRDRPELSVIIAEAVGNMLADRFRNAGWHSITEALDAADAYVDRFSYSSLQALVGLVLNKISDANSSQEGSPLLRSALNFLGNDRIVALTKDNTNALGGQLARAIIRLSMDTGAEQQRLMYWLRDVEPGILKDTSDQARLDEVVESLIQKAGMVASSEASGCAQALLIAPAISGVRGVEAAIAGLGKLLASVASGGSGFAAIDAYRPLTLLSTQHDEIAKNAGIETPTLVSIMAEIEAPLHGFWEKAAASPQLFNGFSLPMPTTPNPVIVHNWTFASLAFARAIGRREAMEAVLDRAAQNSLLRPAILTGRAVRVGIDGTPFDLSTIADQPAEAFYAALGERLLQLTKLPPDQRPEVLRALIERCLQIGPSGLDAALFMAGIQDGVELPRSISTDGYHARMRRSSELRLGLMPLFAGVVPGFDD